MSTYEYGFARLSPPWPVGSLGFSSGSPVPVVFCWRSVPSTSIRRALDAAPRVGRPRSGDRLPRMAPMMEDQGLERTVDLARYPLASRTFRERCRLELDHEGALVLPGFMRAPAVNDALSQSLAREGDAFFCTKSHNVFLLSPDPTCTANTRGTARFRRPKGSSPTIRLTLGRRSGLCTIRPRFAISCAR